MAAGQERQPEELDEDLQEYREPLPEGCPPEDAAEINSQMRVYRLVNALPPCEDDFRSQRAERPNAVFPRSVPECRARGISVFVNATGAEKAKQSSPRLRGKMVCVVKLGNGAGRIMSSHSAHRTWWPYATYNILGACEGAP